MGGVIDVGGQVLGQTDYAGLFAQVDGVNAGKPTIESYDVDTGCRSGDNTSRYRSNSGQYGSTYLGSNRMPLPVFTKPPLERAKSITVSYHCVWNTAYSHLLHCI